jgi:acyl-CoA dehydrogenase
MPYKNKFLVNGQKWWTSGANDPRCKFCIFLGKTPNPTAGRHSQHSMIIIPLDLPGITIKRHLTVFGYDDAPHGHAEISFENVEVPAENLLLGEGRGFEISQGRLGPGRIHHCMRSIGLAERALELLVKRALERKTFGKLLVEQGVVLQLISQSRCEIDQARLLCLNAAQMMDLHGNKKARQAISMIKIVAPNVVCAVLDRAIQIHGGAGVSQDFPLAYFYASARTLRLADGPDEVHHLTVGRLEVQKYRSRL